MSVKTCEIHTGRITSRNALDPEPYRPCRKPATHHHEDRGRDVYTCPEHAAYIRQETEHRPRRVPIAESERHTVQIKLRLPPDVAKDLRQRAGEDGVSAYVARMVRESA